MYSFLQEFVTGHTNDHSHGDNVNGSGDWATGPIRALYKCPPTMYTFFFRFVLFASLVLIVGGDKNKHIQGHNGRGWLPCWAGVWCKTYIWYIWNPFHVSCLVHVFSRKVKKLFSSSVHTVYSSFLLTRAGTRWSSYVKHISRNWGPPCDLLWFYFVVIERRIPDCVLEMNQYCTLAWEKGKIVMDGQQQHVRWTSPACCSAVCCGPAKDVLLFKRCLSPPSPAAEWG